nr:unnamed protein product [Callosobruchus analis]
MRPYPYGNFIVEKTMVNKGLSRARVTIAYAFAILSNKWRVSMKSIETYTKHTKLIIKVASLRHNIVSEVNGYDVKILQCVRLTCRIETLLQDLGAIIELHYVPPPYEISTRITL